MGDVEQDVQALERGELPAAARARLDALRARGGSFFTSDLSTSEFLLVRRAGFRPLSQVMGSCFYNVGWQWLPQSAGYGPWGTTYAEGRTVELETQTEAWNEARRRALARLAEEAKRVGADAVVGVRLQRGSFDWAAGLLEFVAVGTAVRSQRYELGGEPVLSNLSGQQFAALFEHGFWPAGLVAATTVAYAMTGWRQQSRVGGLFSGLQNQELVDFTRGVYDTRSQTMLRLNRQAHELQAHGVVGVEIEQSQHEHERDVGGIRYTDLVVTMHVVGTAIVELEQRGERPVYIALPLDEERR
jgi:uncharacterized protein YbjQ (UPF0145 family)